MNGKIKTLIAIIVSLALCLSVLGCQSETASSVASIETETQESSSQVEIEEAPSEDEVRQNKAKEILSSMTLEEKLYQLFFVTPDALTGVSGVTMASETTKNALLKRPVGGIIYFESNIASEEQLKTMAENSQAMSKIGLFLAADEEGGSVRRIAGRINSLSIPNMYSFKDDGEEVAKENAKLIAGELSSYGLNVDFAPVADVWSNKSNTVIGNRAYSDSFEQAAKLISAAVDGFHEKNIICTLKHFPGHGNTSEDSHTGAAYNYKTKEELSSQEFLPFISGIDAGADMVMVGHIVVPDVDSLPASISEVMITEILRNDLGFNGVIISDSLQMAAVANTYSSSDLAVRVVKAGGDMILMPMDFNSAYNGLLSAVNEGTITEERIDESVLRILNLKLEYGIIRE